MKPAGVRLKRLKCCKARKQTILVPHPRKTAAQLDECPYACDGRDAARQRPLADRERARISVRANEEIGKQLGQPRICSHCGAVYLREPHAHSPLGMLDGKSGPGWHSRNYP